MASEKTTYISLLDQEMVILDGHCRSEIQSKVDEAKERLSAVAKMDGLLAPRLAQFIADVIALAKSKGVISYARETIPTCPLCNRNDGYYPVQRTTKYKRKGEPDRDRPILFAARDFDRGFVNFKNRVSLGGCEACVSAALPFIMAELADLKVELPRSLTGLVEPRYKVAVACKCSKCGWEGHELELGLLPAVMGGEYRGKCPKCDAVNLPFGGTLIVRDHDVKTVVENPDFFPTIQMKSAEFDQLSVYWSRESLVVGNLYRSKHRGHACVGKAETVEGQEKPVLFWSYVDFVQEVT